ncbi:MAG TPA: tetratricopeptide repeat protein [Burkholderiales bacterium]|jgi:regulator of sirC expression with transglutaminase-like and TPR domain|nr:tetratricopeptide repeat protein [Burkholderiales bacterium]
MAALEPFTQLLAGGDERIELARACLLIAEDAYPGLDVEGYVNEVARLALRLRARLSRTAGAEEKVVELNQFLFDELGYTGNAEEYYDPRNSYLNDVIDRRTGIPITLSVLYMELGRKIGLPLEGVSFPGHFLVRVRMRGGMLVLDPFTGGEPQTEDELRTRLERVIPRDVTGGVPVRDLPLEQFLEPATNRQILARLLRNLKGIYRQAEMPERMLDVLNRALVVSPDSTSDLRDRGVVYEQLQAYRAALRDLSDYVAREPDAADIDEMRVKLIELSSRCARLN